MTMGGRRQVVLRSRLGEESRDEGLEERECEDMGLFWRPPATSSERDRQDMVKSEGLALILSSWPHGALQLFTEVTIPKLQIRSFNSAFVKQKQSSSNDSA